MVTFTAPGGESGGMAFVRELYKKYGRLMYATVRRSIPNSQDCEDVVQAPWRACAKKFIR